MLNLKGLNVAITGGFGGIGKEVCKSLLAHGIGGLAILDIRNDTTSLQELSKISPNTKIFYDNIDVTQKSSVDSCLKRVIEQLKHINIFINCSGVLCEDNPEKTLNVNLLGTIHTTMTAMEVMGKHNGGKGGLIVNVASVLGLSPCTGLVIYSGSKHGVVGFTRSLADDFYYNKTGVKLLIICPGITETTLISASDMPTTFSYSRPMVDLFFSSKKQKGDVCGANIVKAIQSDKNGSIWICDLGKLEEVNPTEYWRTQH